MANEITFTASLSVSKIPPMASPDSMNIANAPYNLSSGLYVKQVVLVPITTAVLIPLGQVTTPGWAVFYNSDSTNFIRISLAIASQYFLKILPGRMNFCTLDPGVTPYMIADTAACLMQYMILNGG